MYTISLKRPRTASFFHWKRKERNAFSQYSAPSIRSHTKGCDETPTKYRIWGCHILCNPPAVKHLAVEARHWIQHFARHFIKIWRVSRSTLMWTISMNVLSYRRCKDISRKRKIQYSHLFLTLLFNIFVLLISTSRKALSSSACSPEKCVLIKNVELNIYCFMLASKICWLHIGNDHNNYTHKSLHPTYFSQN